MSIYSYPPRPINGLLGNDMLSAWERILHEWPSLLCPDSELGPAINDFAPVWVGSAGREDAEIAWGVTVLEQILKDQERAAPAGSSASLAPYSLSRSWSFGVRDDGLSGARLFPTKERWDANPLRHAEALCFSNLLAEGEPASEAAARVRAIDRWSMGGQSYEMSRIIRTGLQGKQRRSKQVKVSYKELFPDDHQSSSPVSAVFFDDTAEAPATLILRRIS